MDDLFGSWSVPYQNGAVIKVVGVGGAGGNAVANMMSAGIGDVEFIAVNTDFQALEANPAPTKILLGRGGLGAGSNPEIGKNYALERAEDIRGVLRGADMVIITCGLGGGTGTGASPVVAAEAKSAGALTVAMVYMPAVIQGVRRCDIAKKGLEELTRYADSYMVIPNDGMQSAGKSLTFSQAQKIADGVLVSGVQGLCEIAGSRGHINIDFYDICTVMREKGRFVAGIGTARGENRARQAFENALKSPLLADTGINGAYGVLLNISGNEDDLMSDELAEIYDLVYEQAGEEALIIDGIGYDDRTDGTISVTIVATGIGKCKHVKIADKIAAKKTGGAAEIENKLKEIYKSDRNLRTLDDSQDIFEIPAERNFGSNKLDSSQDIEIFDYLGKEKDNRRGSSGKVNADIIDIAPYLKKDGE